MTKGNPCSVDRAALSAAFEAHTAGQTHFTRRMVITIADMFGMTPRQVVRHFEATGLLRSGSWHWFRENGGINAEHVRQVRSERLIHGAQLVI